MTPKLPRSPLTTRLSGSARETEQRIRNIFQWQKRRPPVLVLVLAAGLIALCGFLVSFQARANTSVFSDSSAASLPYIPPVFSARSETETVPFSGILGCRGTVTRTNTLTEDGHTYTYVYDFQADLPDGTSLPLASLTDPVYADLDGDGQMDLLSAPGGTYFTVWRRWPDGSIRAQSLAPAAAEIMNCSADDITALRFQEEAQAVSIRTSSGREETYPIKELLEHSHSGTIQVYPAADGSAPLAAYGTNPADYLRMYFSDHMDLDGTGDRNDSVTIFCYGFDASPQPLTIIEVTLGTGETLRWEEEDISFADCFSAYLTTPDRQFLVLALAHPYSPYHYTDYVILSLEHGTLKEWYRLDWGNGLTWVSGAYTQEREDGLSDLRLPVLSSDKTHTLWYTLSWSGDQFVLSQPTPS